MKIALYLGVTFILLTSCKKEEGVGGKSAITGNLTERTYNEDYSILQSETPSADEDVYIIYGDDQFYGDKVETQFDGTFRFEYLRPGDYTLYYYSDDSASGTLDSKVAIQKDIHISKDGDQFDAGTLYKYKSLDWNEGHASVSGTAYIINFRNNFTAIKDTAYAQEEDIYLLYGDHLVYDERFRISYDGVYQFKNLIKGHYKIIAYSDDKTGATQKIPVIREFDITETDQVVLMDDIYLVKE